jgi:hypothetical protein
VIGRAILQCRSGGVGWQFGSVALGQCARWGEVTAGDALYLKREASQGVLLRSLMDRIPIGWQMPLRLELPHGREVDSLIGPKRLRGNVAGSVLRAIGCPTP